jgi:hypothetical protein
MIKIRLEMTSQQKKIKNAENKNRADKITIRLTNKIQRILRVLK